MRQRRSVRGASPTRNSAATSAAILSDLARLACEKLSDRLTGGSLVRRAVLTERAEAMRKGLLAEADTFPERLLAEPVAVAWLEARVMECLAADLRVGERCARIAHR